MFGNSESEKRNTMEAVKASMDTRPLGEVSASVVTIQREIDALSERLKTLADRLDDVLVPEMPQPISPNGNNAIEPVGFSPLLRQISYQIDRIRMMTSGVEHLLERIQL